MKRMAQIAAKVLERQGMNADREQLFRTFVNSHRDRAVRLAWRLTGGDGAAAEDVAQDAFFKAYKVMAQFREESSLATWYYRILVRQAHSYRRWRAVRERWSQLWAPDMPNPYFGEPPDPRLRQRIVQALDHLPRGQREAFILVHLEGFTISEAAAVLKKSSGTVKSHLHRGLQALRTALADLNSHGGGSEQ
jgi:RNA polymerase sigma-70 factor (ECF subfamily)